MTVCVYFDALIMTLNRNLELIRLLYGDLQFDVLAEHWPAHLRDPPLLLLLLGQNLLTPLL